MIEIKQYSLRSVLRTASNLGLKTRVRFQQAEMRLEEQDAGRGPVCAEAETERLEGEHGVWQGCR